MKDQKARAFPIREIARAFSIPKEKYDEIVVENYPNLLTRYELWQDYPKNVCQI